MKFTSPWISFSNNVRRILTNVLEINRRLLGSSMIPVRMFLNEVTYGRQRKTDEQLPVVLPDVKQFVRKGTRTKETGRMILTW